MFLSELIMSRYVAGRLAVWIVLVMSGVPLMADEAATDGFAVGTAVIDITPPQGYRMAGYYSERINTGTHDPLLARALVLKQGGEHAAIVICDILFITRQVSQQARKEAFARTGIPVGNIAVFATHSHTGPLYFGPLRDELHRRVVARQGTDPCEKIDYSTMLAGKIVEVIGQAHAAVHPAKIEMARARETRLSFNRRYFMKDGTVRFNPGQQNPDIVRPAGPVDPDVGILLFQLADSEKPLASLTVFALHLDTRGGMLYSADYPYYLEQRMKKRFGDGFLSLFGTGTCGDINHIDVKEKGRRDTETIGNMLAETVLAGLADPQPVERPSLAMKSAVLEVPIQQFEPEQVARAEKDMAKAGTPEMAFLDQVKAVKIMDARQRGGVNQPMEIQAIRLSSEVALVALPGEIFVELGLAVKKASPFKTTMVIELANDAPHYIPTRKAFAEGSYETINSIIQPGGGEQLADKAIQLLQKLKK